MQVAFSRVVGTTNSRIHVTSYAAIANSLLSSSVLKRYYWWRRKKDEPPKEGKTDGKEKTKEEELEKTKSPKKDRIANEGAVHNNANFPSANEGVKALRDFFDKQNEGLSMDAGNSMVDDNIDNVLANRNRADPFSSLKGYEKASPLQFNEDLVIPAIPLPLRPLLPGFMQSLTISDRRTIQKLREIQTSRQRYVGLFLRRVRSSNDIADNPDIIKKLSDVFNIGTCAELQDVRMMGTHANIVLFGRSRIKIKECVEMGPPTLIKASRLALPPNDLDEITLNAYTNEVFSYTQLITRSNPILSEYLVLFMQRREMDNPLYFADFAGGLSNENRELQQKLLESTSYTERFNMAIKLFNQELQTIRLQEEIKKKVESNTKGTERKYILKEQMKVIQQELGGDKDPKTAYIEKVKNKVDEMKKGKANDAAIKSVEEEVSRLNYTDIQSAEFSVIRNYIDWVTCLPWNIMGNDQMNLLYAEKILNEEHYGLKDVKDRILEFIAVGKLQGSIPGKVLCFVGPPGTGKTSIAKSIAHALDRKYFQFSVGGVNDVSQIKGHRRTYVGSMPGKLIQCLKTTQVNNPLILIDEIDKIAASHQGDPASALLEVLDPNQNNAFVDNYLDIPMDFSKALFVCTANDASGIPQPLLDRMEVIRVSGYDYKEKLEISKNYLDKKARKATGLEIGKKTTPESLRITDEALNCLIRWYCREAGVRNLEKSIEKIYRKVAIRIAKMTAEEIHNTDFTITEKDLETYIGKRIFLSDRLYDETPAGVVMGLAWTSMGGATLYIECQTIKPHPLDTAIHHIDSMGESVPSISSVSSPVLMEDGNGSDSHKTPSVTPATPATSTTPVTVGHLSTTGQLGDVMKESIQIAYINARHWMQKLSYSQQLYDSLISDYTVKKAVESAIPPKDSVFNILETSDLHMHLPEGATPKDGPSAGCAITTSLLSTALNRPVKQGLAMTGEISLTGKVLAVGGIKEKVIAARRAGVNEIIVPAENARDINELPDYIRENLTVHYAKSYDTVLKYSGLCPEIFK